MAVPDKPPTFIERNDKVRNRQPIENHPPQGALAGAFRLENRNQDERFGTARARHRHLRL